MGTRSCFTKKQQVFLVYVICGKSDLVYSQQTLIQPLLMTKIIFGHNSRYEMTKMSKLALIIALMVLLSSLSVVTVANVPPGAQGS